MRYLIAAIVSSVLILGMFVFRWRAEQVFQKETGFKSFSDIGPDVGMELSEKTLMYISVSDILQHFQVMIICVILFVSFGVAILSDRSMPPASNKSSPLKEK